MSQGRDVKELPVDVGVLASRAQALEELGKLEESLACLDQCIRLQAAGFGEFYNRANLLTRLSRRHEAIDSLDEAIARAPHHVDAWIKRAYLLHQVDRRADALQSSQHAVSIDPTHLGALNTRGMILDDMGHRAAACADFNSVLAVDPRHAEAMTNLAICHARSGEFHEALTLYDRSLRINPNQLNAVYNRAVIHLVLGDWTAGFRDFESRWALFPHEASRLTRLAPRWTGQEDLKGKIVLLHHEQGFGDTLQFSRYAALVAQRGARVLLAVPAGLSRVMKSLPGSPQIVSEGEPVPPHDFHCPLMSLPLAFQTTPATVPGPVPYLRPDAESVRAWGQRLGPQCRIRIGLVWSGRRYPPINQPRDMTFDLVRPLLALNADFVCLHPDLSDEEAVAISAYPQMISLGKTLIDFADTAAVIANLDLVITVDSAVAHLAGAMGKPVWLMNRYASCWRWLLDRVDSPWYPSLRQFRQPAFGDWVSVVEDVLRAGIAFISRVRPREFGAPTSDPQSAPTAVSNDHDDLQAALERHKRGDLNGAARGYQLILENRPDRLDARHYLGVALCQLGQHAQGLAHLERAVRAQPADAALRTHFGNALAGLLRYEEAIESYERALGLDNTQPDTWYNLGIAQALIGQTDRALQSYERTLELDPTHARAHNNRGNVLLEFGQSDLALDAYERALEICPTMTDALINRAHLLRRQHRYDEALVSAEEAVTLEPHNAAAHNCRGAVLADMGDASAALASYERALTLEPTLTESRWNKGLVLLGSGALKDGWPLYEARVHVKSLKLIERFRGIPRLDPSNDVQDKTVVLYGEQGYGDSIQFFRYCALLVARGARVRLSVPAPLQRLMASRVNDHEMLTSDSSLTADFQCALPSLPYVFGTDLTTIPDSIPYLSADPLEIRRWAGVVKFGLKRPTVGLVWSGRATHQNDYNRSIPLERLLPLIGQPVQWISLQKDIRPTDMPVLSASRVIQRLGEKLADFADAAGLLSHLDLVITVDTAIAHLAGAMGKPVWILLPYVADWRWLRTRTDTPWYPTARLFRQSSSRRWDEVVAQVGEELTIWRECTLV